MKREYWKLTSVAVCLFCALFILPQRTPALDYEHEIKLKNMSFSWKLQHQQLFIKLVAATQGWIGIGFNPTLGMKNANFILGYVKNGKARVSDEYGVRQEEHIKDSVMKGRNDVTGVSGLERRGKTSLEFVIPLESKDSMDRKIIRDGFTTVLLAYGKGQDNFHSQHRFRTSLKVNLATGRFQ
jgi:hypothetical protein